MKDINERFAQFRTCCDDAPAGTYVDEKELREAIGNAVDKLAREMKRLFGHTPCMSDGAHNVEATIYEWLTKGTTHCATAEGFGFAMDTPARERVIRQMASNRDFLRSISGGRLS